MGGQVEMEIRKCKFTKERLTSNHLLWQNLVGSLRKALTPLNNLSTFLKLIFRFLTYSNVLPLYACLVPVKVKRGCQISCNLSYEWFWATTWVPGIKPRPLREQVQLLTAEPFSQPQSCHFYGSYLTMLPQWSSKSYLSFGEKTTYWNTRT